MSRIAIGMYAAQHSFTLTILKPFWLHITFTTAFGCLFPGICGIIYPEGQKLYSVTMFVNMIGDFVFGPDGCCQYKGQLVLPHNITGPVLYTGFRSGIGQCLKSESAHIIMRRLFGIA